MRNSPPPNEGPTKLLKRPSSQFGKGLILQLKKVKFKLREIVKNEDIIDLLTY